MLLSLVLGGLLQLPPAPPPPPPPPIGGPPARDNAVPRTGTARIRGRVVAGDTGQPLRRVLVRATSAELRENRATTTDADGKYEFTELPGARYSITASKGTFVTLSYGQLRPFEPGKPLEIKDAQIIERVDFALPRGGVIAGRIVDEFGEAVAGVPVSAMRYQFIQGRRQLRPVNTATTNDLGEYRIYGLSPSQYYVSAAMRGPFLGDVVTSGDAGSAYVPTYFPGTSNAGDAQRVSLGIGQTMGDVNLALIAARAARVTGMAVTSDGQPMTGAMLMILNRSSMMMTSSSVIRPDGTFTLSNLSPGDYTLQARSMMVDPTSANPETAMASLTVNSEDVAGVRLVGMRSVTVTGRVILESSAPPSARSAVPALRVFTSPVVPDDMLGGASAPLKEDVSFELKVRPGKVVLRVGSAVPGGTTQSLKAVRLHGSDVTDTGFEVKPGEEVSGLEVELTSKQSEVSGLVTNTRGDAVKDYTVIIFGRDRDRWQPGSRFLQTARPDQDGRYKVKGLPVGDYHAIAVEYVEPGEWTDPEYLDRVRQKATNLTLGDGETKALDLKIQAGTP